MEVKGEKFHPEIDEEPEELSIIERELKEEIGKAIEASEQCLGFIVTEEKAKRKGSKVWDVRCNEAVVYQIPALVDILEKKNLSQLILSNREKEKIQNLIQQFHKLIPDSFEPRSTDEGTIPKVA